MVMGAYGHGEWREAMLGGVTRTMLAEADLPLLMRS
jgi:nucleotide-binding universal stress UspA family protein